MMARRDRTQGFAFVLPSGIKTFNVTKEPLYEDSDDPTETASILNVLDQAIEMIESNEYSLSSVVEELISQLKSELKTVKK